MNFDPTEKYQSQIPPKGLRSANQDVYDTLLLGPTITKAIDGDSKKLLAPRRRERLLALYVIASRQTDATTWAARIGRAKETVPGSKPAPYLIRGPGQVCLDVNAR